MDLAIKNILDLTIVYKDGKLSLTSGTYPFDELVKTNNKDQLLKFFQEGKEKLIVCKPLADEIEETKAYDFELCGVLHQGVYYPYAVAIIFHDKEAGRFNLSDSELKTLIEGFGLSMAHKGYSTNAEDK